MAIIDSLTLLFDKEKATGNKKDSVVLEMEKGKTSYRLAIMSLDRPTGNVSIVVKTGSAKSAQNDTAMTLTLDGSIFEPGYVEIYNLPPIHEKFVKVELTATGTFSAWLQ